MSFFHAIKTIIIYMNYFNQFAIKLISLALFYTER